MRLTHRQQAVLDEERAPDLRRDGGGSERAGNNERKAPAKLGIPSQRLCPPFDDGYSARPAERGNGGAEEGGTACVPIEEDPGRLGPARRDNEAGETTTAADIEKSRRTGSGRLEEHGERFRVSGLFLDREVAKEAASASGNEHFDDGVRNRHRGNPFGVRPVG